MTARRSPQALLRQWHVGEKATIDHLVHSLAPETPRCEPRIHDPVTESGLVVEAQIRKSWSSRFVGLAVF
jgi:hypothetical protein